MKHLLRFKTFLLLAIFSLLAGTSALAQSTSTLTFAGKCSGSGTADDNVAWTVTSDGTESNFDSTKGIHYGTNSATVQYIRLSTSGISGTITKVVVNASTASGVTATVGVTVGGNAFGGNAQSLSASATDYTFTGSAEGNIVVTVTKPSNAAKALYVKSVAVTYTPSGGSSLDPCDLALDGAPVALSFDLYNNSDAQVINYTTSSTGLIDIDGEYNFPYVGTYATFDVDEVNKTITVTPTAVTPSTQTITVNQTGDSDYYGGSVTFTLDITDSTPLPTHTATFSINGTTSSEDFEEGSAIVFPTNIADIEGKQFVGWTLDEISGTTDTAPALVNSAAMGTSDVTYYAVFATVSGSFSQETITIDKDTQNVPTSYGDAKTFNLYTFEGIDFSVQQMYLNGEKLQWRAAGNTNGTGTMYNNDDLGKITSVVLTYNSDDTNKNFTLEIGNNADPTGGQAITPTVNGSVYTFDCSAYDYGYFVMTNGSGAGYLDKLVINYTTGSAIISGYCTTVAADNRLEPGLAFYPATATYDFGIDTFVSLSYNTGFNGYDEVTYSSSDEDVVQVVDAQTGEIYMKSAGTATITATFLGNNEYKPGTATLEITVNDSRTPTTISQDPIVLDLSEVGTLTKLAPVVKDDNDNVVAYSYGQWPTEVSFEIVNDPNGVVGYLENNSGDITINSVVGTAELKAYYNLYTVNNNYRPSECTFTITVYQAKDGIAEFCQMNNNESGTLKLTNAVVLYAHGNDMFVKDATGAMDFYNTGLSYNVGDVLNGTITGTYKLYNNMPELTTPISENTLVATAGSAPTPDEITTSDAADNVCNLVKLSSAAVTENSGKFYVDNVQVYDKFKLNYTIEAGKTYDIVGIMIPYNSTFEICPIEAPVEVNASTTPSITLPGGYNYTMDAKAGGGELSVTCSNMPADPQLEVLFYESDGTTSATYDWISATINKNGNIYGQIQENTGAARTAYFKVHGVDADNNDVYSNLVTFTQEAPVAATPTIVFNPNSIDFDANSGYRTIGGDYFQLKDFDSTPSLEILYYESDGDTEKQGGYDWLTADFNSNNQIDFAWNTNTGAARSAYLKIHAVGTTVYSNLFTVNQAAANVAHYYQKVTADADLTDGQYLIVYEDGSVAFDGGLSTLDAASNTIDVTIVGDKIEGNSTTDAATFTIDVTAGTLQSASGLYIGQTSDANGLADGATAYQNTLSIDADGNADVISSGGAHLRYNATSGQDRFRYFKSSTYTAQKAIQLYKRVEGAMPGYVATPTFDPAAGEVQAGTLVTISTTTANATIRYTTDGSEPTTSNGEEYQKPIVINSDVTIKAIAVDDNQNVSAVATATYTIATSSQLSPELTLDPKSLNVTEGAANGTVTVTTAAGYNGTITVMVDDPSVADASYDAGVITVVYGHAGSAVISVTAGADGDYVEQMEQISVNVSAPVQPAQAGVVVWSEDWSSFDLSTDGETPAANGDFTYAYTDGKSTTKLWDDALAGGSAPELLINKTGGAFTATVPLYGAYGNMTLKFQTNNKLTKIRAKVDDDTNNDITVDPETNVNGKQVYTLPFTVAEGAKQIVLTFTNNTSSNVRIDNFELLAPQVAVNISAVGYSTMYYASSNLVVPAGVTVSTYKVNSSNITESRQYTEGDVLPKANGYVLNGAAGNYTFTATNNDGVADKDNILRGYEAAALTTGPDAGEYLFYLLGVGSGNKVGFFWGADNGAAFTSGSHKAYLAVPKDVANGIRGFYFDGTTTGIDTLNLNVENENAYDLQGRRVQQVQKGGLYIINGKKMLAK